MDSPEYIFCEWQSRLWPAKVLSEGTLRSKNTELTVEILAANEQITVKFMDTKPFLKAEFDKIVNLKDLTEDCNVNDEELTYRRALREARDIIIKISSTQTAPGGKQKEATDVTVLTFTVRRFRPPPDASTASADELSMPTKIPESATEDRPVLDKQKHKYCYFDTDELEESICEEPTTIRFLTSSSIPTDQQRSDKMETSTEKLKEVHCSEKSHSAIASVPENNGSVKGSAVQKTDSQAESSNPNIKSLKIHKHMQHLMTEEETGLSSSELSMEISSPEHSSLPLMSTQYDTEEDMQLPVIVLQQEPVTFIPGAFVWCKYQRFPYWPSLIKTVNRKQKKACIIFLEATLTDPKEKKKSFTVALRTLKHYDCPEKQQLMELNEDYRRLFKWCDSLISDYRIRLGCGSFSGSFIDYCTAAISLPVRREFDSGKELAIFPSADPEKLPEIPEKSQATSRLLPDRKRAARDRANEKLVEFIVKTKQAENHLLDILKGKKQSKWLKKFQSSVRLVNCLETYIEDEDQMELVTCYLQMLCKNMSSTVKQLLKGDQTKFIFEVLLPEALIFAISATEKISYEKAEKIYVKGPAVSKRERNIFEAQILKKKRRLSKEVI